MNYALATRPSTDLSVPRSIAALATLADHSIAQMRAAFGRESSGGYIYLRDSMGNTKLHHYVGELPRDEVSECHRFSQEKACRLLTHDGHSTSWQSRNVQAQKYGGAIRLPSGHVLSFSGLPEHLDEVFCICLAQHMGWLDESGGAKLMKYSENPLDVSKIMSMLTAV